MSNNTLRILSKNLFKSLYPNKNLNLKATKYKLLESKNLVKDLLNNTYTKNKVHSPDTILYLRKIIDEKANFYTENDFLNTATKYGKLTRLQAEKLGSFLRHNLRNTPIYNGVLKDQYGNGVVLFRRDSENNVLGVLAYIFNKISPYTAVHEGHHAAVLNTGSPDPLIYNKLNPNIQKGLQALVYNSINLRDKAVNNLTPEGKSLMINNPKRFNYLFDPLGMELRSRINTAKTFGFTADNVPDEIDYAKKYIKPEAYKDIFERMFVATPVGAVLFNNKESND